MIRKRSYPVIGLSKTTNHILTPINAITYVGGSELVLNMIVKIKTDASSSN
jgi:hypothetical protein